MITINYSILMQNSMPMRKKNKHKRRADQSAEVRKRKKAKSGKPRS
jgi:hypothetical protein